MNLIFYADKSVEPQHQIVTYPKRKRQSTAERIKPFKPNIIPLGSNRKPNCVTTTRSKISWITISYPSFSVGFIDGKKRPSNAEAQCSGMKDWTVNSFLEDHCTPFQCVTLRQILFRQFRLFPVDCYDVTPISTEERHHLHIYTHTHAHIQWPCHLDRWWSGCHLNVNPSKRNLTESNSHENLHNKLLANNIRFVKPSWCLFSVP